MAWAAQGPVNNIINRIIIARIGKAMLISSKGKVKNTIDKEKKIKPKVEDNAEECNLV